MPKVLYEWDIESIEIIEGEEIVLDHQHADKLSDLPTPVNDCEKLVLVRDTDDSRMWAYVDNVSRMLPKYFSRPEADGNYHETNVKVPQRFHREIAREMAR
jgi:hypothetical protein